MIVIAILSVVTAFNPYSQHYLSQLKTNDVFVNAEQNSHLLSQIHEAALKYNKEPDNAKIDRVWKALPGYNGIRVNVQASYAKMEKDQTFNKHKLVFEQIPPTVHLSDLPPSPIFRGHPDKPMVSFLINVAWGEEFIPSMLATLKEHGVHATFFLEGRWVKKNAEMAKMIADAGHEIANHSYSHPKMESISAAETMEELTKTNEIIESTTGQKPIWFGPPSGGYREETILIAHSLNMRTIMWTVDTIDWQRPSVPVLLQRVTSKVHPGAMILMHPTEPTEKALNTLITELKAMNYKIGTVSKLMDEERIIQLED